MALGLFVVLFAVCQTEGFKERAHLLFQILHDLLLRYAGLAAIVMAFYRMRGDLDGNGRITRGMRFMGRRTLDIYFLHYFFLPSTVALTALMEGENIIAMMFLVGIIITSVIIIISLIAGRLIRLSPILASWCFGEK